MKLSNVLAKMSAVNPFMQITLICLEYILNIGVPDMIIKNNGGKDLLLTCNFRFPQGLTS